MQNDVVVVVRSRADVAMSACLELNGPVVIEHMGDISRPDVVGRVEAARLGLCDSATVEHVMHHEQVSTGRHGGEESVFGGVRGSTQQRRVLDGNEVEDPVAERRLEQTRVNPFDVDARTTGSGAGSIERNLGDVQSAHLPILAGQSECVSPFAAADVERPAQRQAFELCDQRGVGLTTPDLPGPGVALVPCRGRERLNRFTPDNRRAAEV